MACGVRGSWRKDADQAEKAWNALPRTVETDKVALWRLAHSHTGKGGGDTTAAIMDALEEFCAANGIPVKIAKPTQPEKKKRKQ